MHFEVRTEYMVWNRRMFLFLPCFFFRFMLSLELIALHETLVEWTWTCIKCYWIDTSTTFRSVVTQNFFFISILFYSFTLVILELWYYIVSPSVMKGSMVYSLNRFIFLGLFLKPTEATKENANVRWWRWYFSGYTLTNKDNCCRFSCVVFVANGNCQCCMCL